MSLLLALYSILGWDACCHFQSNLYCPSCKPPLLSRALQKNVSYVSIFVTSMRKCCLLKDISCQRGHVYSQAHHISHLWLFHICPFAAEMSLSWDCLWNLKITESWSVNGHRSGIGEKRRRGGGLGSLICRLTGSRCPMNREASLPCLGSGAMSRQQYTC